MIDAFQKRADLLLRGEIEPIIDSYQTPMWTRFRSEFYSIADRAEMWSILVRQHLSQKARGVVAVRGSFVAQEPLLHDRSRITIDWVESCAPNRPDASRSFRIVYVCRPTDGGHVITGFSLEETRPPAIGLHAPIFPPPCEDW